MADLDPVRGHEQAGIWPVLVISDDRFNRSASNLAYGVPLTTRDHGFPGHLLVVPPEGGLTRPSYILCDQLRVLSHERLLRRLGVVALPTLTAVELWLRAFLNL
ncbi:MAG: type II toxin-antitoxin system PemK/MazF family toxin [Chloroflexia bacterium]|nr:type II toxin-antitoxin system PemK/MazF family toxin [Chloroflexia bacterium]